MSESFNEIIKRIRTAAHADGPYNQVTYNVLNEVCGNTRPTFTEMFDKMCDMLQEAHDRELEQAYDPQRLRGTKPNTFDGALEALREFRWQHATTDTDAIPYINAVKEAHDRELQEAINPSRECMRQTESEHERKLELLREYGRGRLDGIEFADYRRAKVVRRLQAVKLNDYEEGFALLNDVCRAIYAPEHDGWTRIQVCELRDALVDLLGRKTSELEQERAEVVANLREFNSEEIEPWFEMQFWRLLAHLGIDKSAGESSSCNDIAHVRDRLIHLLGGDPNYGKPRKAEIGDAETESNSWDSPKTINKEDDDGLADRADSDCCDSHGTGDNRGCDTAPDVPCGNNNGAIRSITKELRDWTREMYNACELIGVDRDDLLRIADRIDAEHALVKAIADTADSDAYIAMDEYRKIVSERDTLQKWLDDMREQREHWADEATKMYRLFFSHDEYCVPDNPSEMVAVAVRTLQAKLDKTNGENKGLRMLIDEQKESIAQRKKTIKKHTRNNEKVWKTVHELQAKLDELDQSGATSLYKLLKHTLGEAKQIADSLRASKDTRVSLKEDVREKAAEVEALRQECVMYRTMLNDAVEEYKDATDARDTWFDRFEKAFAEEIEELDDYVLADRGLIRLPKDANGEYVFIGDVMEPVGVGESWTVKAIEYGEFVTLIKEGGGKAVAKYHRHHVEDPDTPDAIARDLLNGSCTRNEAVSRMEKLHG